MTLETPAGAHLRRRRLNHAKPTSERHDALPTSRAGHEHRTDADQRAARADLEFVDSAGSASLHVEVLPTNGRRRVNGAGIRSGRTEQSKLTRELLSEAAYLGTPRVG